MTYVIFFMPFVVNYMLFVKKAKIKGVNPLRVKGLTINFVLTIERIVPANITIFSTPRFRNLRQMLTHLA